MTAQPIPFGDLKRTRQRLAGEIEQAVKAVLDSGWYVLGEEVAAFEREFAQAMGARYAVGVGNGTDAIALALRAAGVQPGGEVVTAPMSAAFTALAISQIGAVPVFVDIEPARATLDPAGLRAALTPRTAAVLPVHLYGQPADMLPILGIAAEHGVPVVGDCAQSHGACYHGRPVASFGVAAAWSFYPSKNLGAFGDAGAVTTDDAEVAQRLRALRNGGQTERDLHAEQGINSRLDEIQAAILRVRLRYLGQDNRRRREIAHRYHEALASVDDADLQAPAIAADAQSAWHLYVVQSPRRDALAHYLAQCGIATRVHYPVPVHCQPAYGGEGRRGSMPAAEQLASRALSLPIYPELTDDEVDRVCDALLQWKGAR